MRTHASIVEKSIACVSRPGRSVAGGRAAALLAMQAAAGNRAVAGLVLQRKAGWGCGCGGAGSCGVADEVNATDPAVQRRVADDAAAADELADSHERSGADSNAPPIAGPAPGRAKPRAGQTRRDQAVVNHPALLAPDSTLDGAHLRATGHLDLRSHPASAPVTFASVTPSPPDPVQRWGRAPRPTSDQDDDVPKPPPGYTWKKPEVARRFLKNYDAEVRKLADQFNALAPLQSSLNGLKAIASDIQKVARGELDRIRRNDIWPNWGTLNHALTVIGTVSTCLEGSCLVGLALGAVSLYNTDSGAAASVATNCLPNPSKPACGEAIANGAASIGADRLDRKAMSERLSNKDRTKQALEAWRKSETYFDQALAKVQALRDPIEDQLLFLSKAYDYALWGNEQDNPFNQSYKGGVLL